MYSIFPINKSTNSKKVKFIPVTKAPTLAEFDTSKKIYTGVSSFYGKAFHGKLTANGEIFDMYWEKENRIFVTGSF